MALDIISNTKALYRLKLDLYSYKMIPRLGFFHIDTYCSADSSVGSKRRRRSEAKKRNSARKLHYHYRNKTTCDRDGDDTWPWGRPPVLLKARIL